VTNHTTSVKKYGRGPFLLPLYEPLCDRCGVVGERTDLDTAREHARRHVQSVEAERLAATTQPTKEKK
jgi:hypothetical protein